MRQFFEEFKTRRNNDDNDVKRKDWKDEKGIIKSYNGRQLFELLQNIDDAKSKKALIRLDTKNRLLFIANKGEPFSKEGLKSIMMAHLSPKDKTFIGNKGLGFRSLFNWLGEIYVKSKGLSIEFSKENRNRKEQKENSKRSISSTPEWINNNNPREWIDKITFDESYITYIVIHYKENVEDRIITQIDELSEEVMHFINNIKEITIEKDDEPKKIFIKEDWKIKKEEALIPKKYQDDDEEEEHYQLKIILPPENKSVSPFLFSYFPTKIKIDFPALIHGTFDLNPSRDIMDDDINSKNQFIVQQLAKFVIKVAEELIDKKDSNWKAYEFVNIAHRHQDIILTDFGFYEIIEKWKETAQIYPCINNIYRDKNSWKFYGKDFSNFMEKHSTILENILKEYPPSIKFSAQYRYHDNLVESFNQISKKISSIEERAEFINHVLTIKERTLQSFEDEEPLILLINQDKKLKEELFFYDDIFIGLEIPSFIEIDYIFSDLQNKLDKNRLYKIATVKEFDIQKDLIEKIIKSDESIQTKLEALYPLRRFNSPSISLKGITNKYIRDKRILQIFKEKEIIEEYKSLGIRELSELDNFLIWLRAKKFDAQQILSIVIQKNNEKKDIPSTLQSLFILKNEFSSNLDNNRIRTSKDIFVLNANGKVKNVKKLFPYNKTCKKENIIASKNDLGLENYTDEEVQSFLEWVEIHEFNPKEVALKKIELLSNKELNRDEARNIYKFLFEEKNKGELSSIAPSTDDTICIFDILAKKLFFRTKLTEKYFDKQELLVPYYELGFEDNEKSKEFFRWLGVKEAYTNLIVKQIFKSDVDSQEKLKELFSLYKKNNSIERPTISLKLKALNGQEKEVKTLYINNDITKFFKKDDVVNIPLLQYSEEFFQWLGLKEPSREDIVKQLLELLTNKNISVKEIEEIISLLYEKYNKTDDIDKRKPRYLLNNKKEVLKISELYQYNELANKHITEFIVYKELPFNEDFLEWIGIYKAQALKIIRTLLKKKHKNLNDIFELWKQDKNIDSLNIPVKLLNKKNEEVNVNKLFLETEYTPFYDDIELVANYEKLGIDSSREAEEFLLWLGVNEYIKYIKEKDYTKVYKLEEISKLNFQNLFALLEVENILNHANAKRDLQLAHPQYKYWILHNHGIDLINPSIEYENNPKKINLLKQFGVKDDFEEKNTFFLLTNLKKIDKDARYAPSIYKKVLDKNFRFSNKKFSVCSKNREYKDNVELYYLTTSRHPKSILKKYDFIDLPINLVKEKIYNTFGVNEIIDIEYKAPNVQKIDSIKFDNYFEEITPYLLAFGLDKIEDIRKKESLANQLKLLKIQFGSFDCFANSELIKLEEFEMISTDNGFYIKCENGISNEFQKNMNLTDSIESILLTIDFNNHSKFIEIFRNSDFEYLEKILSKEYGSTVLEDAKVLLGKAKQEIPNVSSEDLQNEDEKLMIAQREFKKVLEENLSDFEQNLYIWCQKQHQEKKFISLIDKYNNTKINTIEDIDYQEYIIKYVKDNFYFSISAIDEYINIQEIFTKNKELVDSDKIIHIERYRSLLYFEGKLDEIKEYIKSLKNEKPSSENTENEDDSSSTITDVNLTSITTNGGTRGGSSGGTWKPPVSSDSPQVGFTSEERVYNKLVREFGTENVHWSSNGISDSYGYDIWYKNKKNEIKYVEVKTFSNKGRFYISPNEVKFAKDNKDSYELFLVENDKIFRVKNFHKLKKITENYRVNFSVKDLKANL